jgi:hypothetical protein
MALAPRALLLAVVVATSACSYDYSRIPRAIGPGVDGGGADAGSTVSCDPIADTGCSATLTCSSQIDASGALTARCTTPGSGTNGAACSGLGPPGNCGAGLLCIRGAGGAGTCAFVCTESTGCAAGFACDREDPLYSLGARTVYRCR